MNNLKKTDLFYRKRGEIKNIIFKNIKKDNVIYGTSAVNKQIPSRLRVYTEDYDIFSKNPRKEARNVERQLDKFFGGNYFKVSPARYKDTFRIISLIDGKVYADYTKIKKGVKYTTINGKRYITLDYAKKDRLKILRDKKSKYRHKKDKDTINRINLTNKKYNLLLKEKPDLLYALK